MWARLIRIIQMPFSPSQKASFSPRAPQCHSLQSYCHLQYHVIFSWILADRVVIHHSDMFISFEGLLKTQESSSLKRIFSNLGAHDRLVNMYSSLNTSKQNAKGNTVSIINIIAKDCYCHDYL